jgi:hypothetical protein
VVVLSQPRVDLAAAQCLLNDEASSCQNVAAAGRLNGQYERFSIMHDFSAHAKPEEAISFGSILSTQSVRTSCALRHFSHCWPSLRFAPLLSWLSQSARQ